MVILDNYFVLRV